MVDTQSTTVRTSRERLTAAQCEERLYRTGKLEHVIVTESLSLISPQENTKTNKGPVCLFFTDCAFSHLTIKTHQDVSMICLSQCQSDTIKIQAALSAIRLTHVQAEKLRVSGEVWGDLTIQAGADASTFHEIYLNVAVRERLALSCRATHMCFEKKFVPPPTEKGGSAESPVHIDIRNLQRLTTANAPWAAYLRLLFPVTPMQYIGPLCHLV